MFVPNGLSADQAPPFSSPIRFFLTAPIFAILAGCLLLFYDSSEFSRSSFVAVAFIHLLTLGFAGFVMIGALQQMLPVLAGVNFPKPKLLASFLHITLSVGVILMACGFIYSDHTMQFLSSIFLIIPILIFAGVIFYVLSKVDYANETVNSMKYAVISLIFVAFSGGFLLISHASENFGDIFLYVKFIHVNFASFGWIFLLILGVSFQVIPMFWGSSDYKNEYKRYLVYTIFGFLILLVFLPLEYFSVILSFMTIVFSIFTLQKLTNRKRKIFDIAVVCWQIALASLILASVLIAIQIIFHISLDSQIFVSFGVGFVMSVIFGMLYKIVPFLSWFHLSGRGVWDIPSIKEMISKRALQTQIIFHFVAFGLLFFAFLKIGAVFFIISNILFLFNIAKPVWIFIKRS